MLTWFRSFAPIDRKRVLLLGLSVAVSIVFGFFAFEQKTAVTIVHRAGYYWILLSVVLFGWALAKAFTFQGLKAVFVQAGVGVVAVVVVITAWIHVQEPHGFKVVNDEIMLVSSSQRMHDRREAGTIARGYDLGARYTVMQGVMDKRPVLFPFLVSLIHDATGYRPQNAFWLNALLTPLFLFLLYFVAQELGGRLAGLGALLLWATLPLFVQITNGAGFELLNLVMILAVFLLGLKYVEARTSARLSALCLGAILLAQVRYESVLYVIPVGLVIVYGWIIDRRVSLAWGVICAPLLLIITPLHANVVKVSPNALQLESRPSSGGIYNISYFYDNVGSALNYFFSTDGLHANSHILAALGGLGVAFLFMVIYRDAKQHKFVSPVNVVFRIMLCALLAQSVLMICYFWGDYSDWITVRLSLPTQLLFVLAFVYIYPELVAWRQRWTALMVVSCAFIICWTIPSVVRRGYSDYNQAAEYSNWCGKFAQSLPDRNILVVDPLSRVWSLYGIGCISADTLAERSDGFMFHFNRGSFKQYIVVQQLELADAKTGAILPARGADFGGAFKLTKIHDVSYSPTSVVRLSSIDSVNEAAFAEWAKARIAAKGKPAIPPRLTSGEQQKFMQEWMSNLP